ncbi:hypothetical protein EAL2_c13630 [Peptoclostridium acidaminophilum DSM 3953]|uniref:Flagellar hook-length control protein-like C-terminal domain-containing protein n=1 Tax=Peptoclostridium acidaminophilum DSM 3953 TaxID=1286171 RepID=W8TFR5_PEPAC|nr:flagellar hook-length control protein FliK [Peptoclostridium acidaminophilum]AHM56658.1 hypothetical protein EAL2_c13630 [Peptoclostridium acidaminophilum DSM 3953]
MNKLSVLPMKAKEDFKTKDTFSKSNPAARDEFAGTLEKMKSKIDKKQKSEGVQKEELKSSSGNRSEKKDVTIDSQGEKEDLKAVKAENENIFEDVPQPADAERVELAGAENIFIDKSIIKDLKELAVKPDAAVQAAVTKVDAKTPRAPGSEVELLQNDISIEAGMAADDKTMQAPAAKSVQESGAQNSQNAEFEDFAEQDAIMAVVPDKDKGSQKKGVRDEAALDKTLHEKPENILGQSIKKFIAERNGAGQQFSAEETKDPLDSIKEEILKLSEESEEFKFSGFSQDTSSGRISQELMKTRPVYYSQREVVEQVINKMKIIDADNLKAIEIKLEPEQLGKLTLKVVMENGILTARLVAESDKVKAAIESNIAQLKDSMHEQGINISAVDVSVDSGTQSGKGHEDGFEASVRSKRISSAVFNDAIEDAAVQGGIEANNPYMLDEEINYLA